MTSKQMDINDNKGNEHINPIVKSKPLTIPTLNRNDELDEYPFPQINSGAAETDNNIPRGRNKSLRSSISGLGDPTPNDALRDRTANGGIRERHPSVTQSIKTKLTFHNLQKPPKREESSTGSSSPTKTLEQLKQTSIARRQRQRRAYSSPLNNSSNENSNNSSVRPSRASSTIGTMSVATDNSKRTFGLRSKHSTKTSASGKISSASATLIGTLGSSILGSSKSKRPVSAGASISTGIDESNENNDYPSSSSSTDSRGRRRRRKNSETNNNGKNNNNNNSNNRNSSPYGRNAGDSSESNSDDNNLSVSEDDSNEENDELARAAHRVPPSQTELEYVALSPVELVIQNLREAMLSDVPIHQLEEEPENWANVRWYMISSSFPIIAASIGPLANLCSTVSIADTWRLSEFIPNLKPADLPWVYALNAVSLLLGVISNISLFMNFTGLINHRLSQFITVGGWYIASFILVGLLAASQFVYFQSHIFRHYIGFWFGAIAAILYFLGATLLLINEIGRRLKRSSMPYTITAMQRRLMLLNVIFMMWIGMGGGMFTALIKGLTYGDAVYFSMGVCLTVAAGDILPKTHLARTLTIPYAYGGVLLVGLSIAAISSAIREANGISLVYRRVEQSRRKMYKKLLESNEFDKMKPEGAFDIIRKIHEREQRHAEDGLVIKSLIVFAFFWLMGALVFSLAEGWSYFEAIYFCGLIFVANSFGDFTPSTPGGRSFFVVWTVGAVPLMTILISSLGSTIFARLTEGGDYFTAILVKLTKLIGSIRIGGSRLSEKHSRIFGVESQSFTTSRTQSFPVTPSRPGQPLFLRSATTLSTSDSIDDSLLHDWPDSSRDNSSSSSASLRTVSISSTVSDDDRADGGDNGGGGGEGGDRSERGDGGGSSGSGTSDRGNEIDNDKQKPPENDNDYEDVDEDDLAYGGDDDNDDDPINNIAVKGSDEESSENDDDGDYAQILMKREAAHIETATSSDATEPKVTLPTDRMKNNIDLANAPDVMDLSKPIKKPPTSKIETVPHQCARSLLAKIHTKRMLVLTKHIRLLCQGLAQNPEMKYSYKEWCRMLKIVHLQIGVESPNFWLSSITPLRVPIVEACFFLLTSLTALDEEVAEVIHLQQGTVRPHAKGERVGYFATRKKRRPVIRPVIRIRN